MDLLAQSSQSNAIVAVIVIAAGFFAGSLAAAIARQASSGESRPEVIRTSSGALATLAFSIILIIALVIALGIVNRTALDQLSTDVVTFLPLLLSAAIVLIIGNIVGALAEAGVTRSLGHVSPELRNRLPALVKYAISGFSLVIAANQLGIDTTIILVVVAALFFGLALAFALLAAYGGRPIAEQVAAGRALRRELSVGDSVKIGTVSGQISAIGSTSTQITSRTNVMLVPNVELLRSTLEVVETAEVKEGDEEN